jgi:tetratricopeptide (TPR) repeat protein
MVEARWILGLAFTKRQLFSQAESQVSAIEGLVKEPGNESSEAYYHHLLGELLLGEGLYQEAVENFNRAAEIRSLDRTLFLNALGQAYFKIGELNLAVEELRAVLEMNPNYAESHYLLGQIHQEKGEIEKAKYHFQRFVEIWKEADENLPQLVDAQKQLETL